MISSSVTDLPVLNSMNTATTSTRRLSATSIATACFTASCFTRIASTSAAGWTLTPSDSSSEQQTSMINGPFLNRLQIWQIRQLYCTAMSLSCIMYNQAVVMRQDGPALTTDTAFVSENFVWKDDISHYETEIATECCSSSLVLGCPIPHTG